MLRSILFSFLVILTSWEVCGEFVEQENLQNVSEEKKELFEEFEARILEKMRDEIAQSLAAFNEKLEHNNDLVCYGIEIVQQTDRD